MKKENIDKTMKKITLSQSEKERIRGRLVHELQLGKPNFGSRFIIKHKFMGAAALGLILALSLGGGVSYAAQDALPGDTLYPVKTEINEEVRGWFVVGDEAEAEYRGKLAEERLEELEEIAENRSERLSDVRDNIEEKFEEHVARVEERLENIAEEDSDKAAELSARLEKMLENHERVLERFEEKEEKIDEKVEEAKERIVEKREKFEERSAERLENRKEFAEEKISAKIERVRNMIAHAETFLSEHPNITDESKEKAEEIIGEVTGLIDEAEALNGEGEYQDALVKLNEAVRYVHRARSAMTIEERTGIRDFVRDRIADEVDDIEEEREVEEEEHEEDDEDHEEDEEHEDEDEERAVSDEI